MRLFHPAVRVCKSSQEKAGELQSLQQLQRRTRRHRTIFTEEQLQALETLFHQNQYPDVVTREHLANRIHLKEERVEVRFCHLVRGCCPPGTQAGALCSFLGELQTHGLILKSIIVHLTKESLSLASNGRI